MAKKDKRVVIAYFPGADKAGMAADELKDWDKAIKDIKLGWYRHPDLGGRQGQDAAKLAAARRVKAADGVLPSGLRSASSRAALP